MSTDLVLRNFDFKVVGGYCEGDYITLVPNLQPDGVCKSCPRTFEVSKRVLVNPKDNPQQSYRYSLNWVEKIKEAGSRYEIRYFRRDGTKVAVAFENSAPPKRAADASEDRV